MNGIVLRESLLSIFFITFLFYNFVSFIYFLKEQKNTNKTEKIINDFNIYEKVKKIVIGITVITIIVVIFRVTIKSGLPIMPFVLIILSTLAILALLPKLIGIFVGFLFFEHNNLELDYERENTINIIGVIALLKCAIIAYMGDLIIDFCSINNAIICDLIKIICLVVWYFLIIFYILAYIILSLHYGILFFSNSSKKKRKKNEKGKKVKKNNKINYALKIEKRIQKDKQRNLFSFIILHIIWFICVVIDGILLFVVESIALIKIFFIIICIFPFKFIYNRFCRFLRRVEKNVGENIVFVAKLTIIISLLIIYFVNNYNNIFSYAGTECYEFLCSVIIIPLVISELSDRIKKKR